MLSTDFMQMLIRFVICLVVDFIIVDRLYYPKSKRRDFYFTYILTSIAVFFLMYFMMDMKAKATMGIGIGLFGIFSIMRFRTDAMPVREMTYLFVIISMSVISAIAPIGNENGLLWTNIAELLLTDVIIIAITYLCESMLKVKAYKLIQYDRVELVVPQKYEELVDDLKKRTGLDIIRAEVGGIDFLKDSAVVKIYYNPHFHDSSNSVNDQFRVRRSQFREI
jgi:hypothetical protein